MTQNEYSPFNEIGPHQENLLGPKNQTGPYQKAHQTQTHNRGNQRVYLAGSNVTIIAREKYPSIFPRY